MRPITRLAVGALAIGLVGALFVAPGQPEAGAAVQRTMRIPSSAFQPAWPTTTIYQHYGDFLSHDSDEHAAFVAPVVLEGNTATVTSVTLHYLDGGSDTICMQMWRQALKTGGSKLMSSFCTKGALGENRNRTDVTIDRSAVASNQAVYLWIDLPPGIDYRLTGVTVVYTVET